MNKQKTLRHVLVASLIVLTLACGCLALAESGLMTSAPETTTATSGTSAVDFATQFAAMEAEKGPMIRWSLEDKASLQALMDAAGMASEGVIYGLPGEDDIPVEEAERIATETVKSTYGLTDEDLTRFVPCFIFNIFDAENPVYQVTFELEDMTEAQLEGYTVCINARTGEVTETYSPETDAVG